MVSQKLQDAYRRIAARADALRAIGITPAQSITSFSKKYAYYRYMGVTRKEPEAHLRKHGNVMPDFHHQRTSLFNAGKNSHGWYCDPDQDVYKDGSGLVWGVVFLLPARRGVMQMLAGWQHGGSDYTNIAQRIFTYDRKRDGETNIQDEIYNEVAYAADQLAKKAAEDECEYQLEQRELDNQDGDHDNVRTRA